MPVKIVFQGGNYLIVDATTDDVNGALAHVSREGEGTSARFPRPGGAPDVWVNLFHLDYYEEVGPQRPPLESV